MTRRLNRKALWSGAITVAILAIVLIVLGAIGPLRQKHVTGPAAESERLYQQAVEAQQSGDLTRTAELARSAVQADPANSAARALLAATTRQRTEASQPAAPTGSTEATPAKKPTASSDEVFLKKYRPLSVLLPSSLKGFELGSPAELGPDVTMSGSPKVGGRPVFSLIWAVHDLKTRSAAKRFVTRAKRGAFPKDAGAVTIDGVVGYFGTDGTKFATVVYARGRYAFEVLVTAVAGAKPVETKTTALEAAKAFPDSPRK